MGFHMEPYRLVYFDFNLSYSEGQLNDKNGISQKLLDFLL